MAFSSFSVLSKALGSEYPQPLPLQLFLMGSTMGPVLAKPGTWKERRERRVRKISVTSGSRPAERLDNRNLWRL